ncbi:MAG: GNAT family N-acetyltransferase [Lachnospiraceae bacterium]|nr:GNAT family N-acetyltransferase [Lachnospiraceae bacterium]
MNEKIRFYEEMASNAHVALNVMQYDGWLLRFAIGYTNRANSISALYPSTIDLDHKISYCEGCYKKQNLPCVFKITDQDMELNAALQKRGYEVVTPTDVMLLDLSEQQLSQEGSCMFWEEPIGEWLTPYFLYEGIMNEDSQNTFCQMLSKVQVDTIYCGILHDGKVVACASAAIEQGYMLLQNVVVDPQFRGCGFGKMVCSALLSKAKEEGAQYSYLQVIKNNEIALNLYAKLGYKKVYSYWYMKKEVIN